MATYSLPNPSGTGSITATGTSLANAEANAASSLGLSSWTGGSYGADSLQGGGGGGGGGGGDGGLSANEQAQLAAFQASAGFSIKDLDEKKRQFDASLEWTKQMWANQGLPELQIKQQAQALAEQEFAVQTELARANLALAQKTQADALGISQGTLGLDYLKTAASMGGPSDYFQQANFLRGASANSNVPTFLNALTKNTGLSAFTAPGGGGAVAPTVQSAAGLAGALTGAGSATDQQAALNTIGGIGAAGGQALGPQALESLNPDEMGLLSSGLTASGFSTPSFLQAYQQSRIGQGSQRAA